MFNDRKLTTGHGFVKAYSNNWLSQLGAVYKYESPKDVLRKPNNQHRKIALYSVLAMAFVAFFTLFMIVHEAERKTRQLVIESSFSNETAIEPSAGSQDTILTTPLSSGVLMGNATALSEMDANGAEHREVAEGSREVAMKRTRRLRYYGDGVEPVGRDRLVLLPARFLKPPPPAPRERRKWSGEEAGTEAERRRDGAPSIPKPFRLAPNGPLPAGFQQPQQEQPVPEQQSRANRSSLESLAADLAPFSIQDIIRQLTLAKRKQQQQFYYNYPYRPSPQPSEFNHPVHQNHRVKFTGIYRHPRKNGDVTTLFGAASQRGQDVHVQAPQLINQQLGATGGNWMPDRLYNFKPQNPSEVNLLATEQFRFAPQKDSTEEGWSSRWPKEGMPFSVMLNLEPMGAVGGRLPVQPQHQQHQQQHNRYKKRYRNPLRNPYRQSWAAGSGGNNGEQNFAQLSPYHHRSRPQNNLYRDAFGQGAAGDDYEGENYFRKEGRVQPRIPAYASPLIGPGRLMVHFNIFPRQQSPAAARRNSGLESEENRLRSTAFGAVELNAGETIPSSSLPNATESEPALRHPLSPQWSAIEEGRSWRPSPTSPIPSWTSTSPSERNLSTTVVEQPAPTVEVIKSIEIPTQINFDHVPLGRNPPPPLPSFNRWTGDEDTIRLWSTKNNLHV
uniref:Uncharacterized protein n=1 Tax=Anopheles atroparvus TaxID=41427 RepID=A0A182J095_ANOAO